MLINELCNAHEDIRPNVQVYDLKCLYEEAFSIFADSKDTLEYEKGLELLLEAANGGLTDAQVAIGQAFYHGLFGLDKNYKAALDWFTLAADKGDNEALYMLGKMYLNGYHVTQDGDKAISYLKIAGEKNYAPAMFLTAKLYHDALHQDNKQEYLEQDDPRLIVAGACKEIARETDIIIILTKCAYSDNKSISSKAHQLYEKWYD